MKDEFDAILIITRDTCWINTVEQNFLSSEHPRLATFYVLPKVNKEPKDHPPGKPVVAANGTITEPSSQYHCLKSYVHKIPSYVKNTTDVLNKLNQMDDTTWDNVVTMDVEALHTNVDHGHFLRVTPPFLYQFNTFVLGISIVK